MSTFIHDPDAVLDYAYDWSPWLGAGETVSSFTVTVPTGITLASSTEAAGVVTAWISGGTVRQAYEVTCHVVTSQGRQDDRTITLRVYDR